MDSTHTGQFVNTYNSKTFEGVNIQDLSKCCCDVTSQLQRQRRIVQQRFCFRSTLVEWKYKNTFGIIPCVCCISNVSMKQFYGRHAYTLQMQHMEFVQTCFCVFIQRMSSENKTAVGQVFVVSVIAMLKRNSI